MDLNREFPNGRKNPPVSEWAACLTEFYGGTLAAWPYGNGRFEIDAFAFPTREEAENYSSRLQDHRLRRVMGFVVKVVDGAIRYAECLGSNGAWSCKSLKEVGAFPGLEQFAEEWHLRIPADERVAAVQGLSTTPPFGGGRSRAQLAADYHLLGFLRGKDGPAVRDFSPGATNEPVAHTLDWSRNDVAPLLAEPTQRSERHLELQQFLALANSNDGRGVTVAVLDTGFAEYHRDKFDARIERYDTTGTRADGGDGNGHGTFCLSEIGANGSKDGPIGAAQGAKLISIKVLTDQGWGTDTMIASGIELARRLKVDVISMSLGGPDAMPGTLAQLELAEQEGISIVAAAGNDGLRGNDVSYPARYAQCSAIGACDGSKVMAGFSNWGPEIEFAAVGVQVLGWSGTGGAALWSGTSMAAPFAAAHAARSIAQGRHERDQERAAAHRQDGAKSALDLLDTGRDTASGSGLIQAYPCQMLSETRWAKAPSPTPPGDTVPVPLAKLREWAIAARQIAAAIEIWTGPTPEAASGD